MMEKSHYKKKESEGGGGTNEGQKGGDATFLTKGRGVHRGTEKRKRLADGKFEYAFRLVVSSAGGEKNPPQ